jgi:8-oxo-dGTP pyrophosphatase MutT (NUDIX family)
MGNIKQLKMLIDMCESNAFVTSLIIHATDYSKLKKDVKSFYTVIEAAGGLIMNEENEFLFIFRRGHWDLPKGKIEKNELKKQAAIREVMEETGIKGVTITHKLLVSYHTFKTKTGQAILKKTHWYFMKAPRQKLKPQRTEAITKAIWMGLDDFEKCKPVYGNILQTIDVYHSKFENPKEIEIDNLI